MLRGGFAAWFQPEGESPEDGRRLKPSTQVDSVECEGAWRNPPSRWSRGWSVDGASRPAVLRAEEFRLRVGGVVVRRSIL